MYIHQNMKNTGTHKNTITHDYYTQNTGKEAAIVWEYDRKNIEQLKNFTLQCNYSSDLSTATGKIKNWDIFSDFFFYELLEKVRVQILISKFWEKNTEKNLKSEIKVWTLSYETCSQNSENSNLTFFSFWK